MKNRNDEEKHFNDLAVKRIKQLCKAKQISIYKIAQDLDLPYSSLSTYIRRANLSTSITMIKYICDGLGISVAEFYNHKYFQ